MVISEREEVVLALTNTPIQTQFVRGKANVISACMRRFREKRFPFCVCRTILQLFNCAFQPRDVTSSLFAFMIRCYGIQLYQLCL